MVGEVGIVRFLVSKDIDVNQRNSGGQTPLLLAAQRNDLNMITCLIEELGADINQVDFTSYSPLKAAVQEGNIEAVRLLRKLGADVKTGSNVDVLQVAARVGNVDMVKYFVEEVGIDVTLDCGVSASALNAAVQFGQLDVLKCLVTELGADVDQADVGGRSPLHVACAATGTQLDMIRLLVKLGADIECQDHEGCSPLYVAAQAGSLDGRREILRCLVKEFGADVDKNDCDGCTPLLVAAGQGHLGVVRCLLKLGAAFFEKDYEGLSPLDHAVARGNVRVVKFLLDEMGEDEEEVNMQLMTSCVLGDLDMVRCLVLHCKADVNYIDHCDDTHIDHVGDTPLLVAARGMHAELAKWLVKAGADPQHRHPSEGSAADISRAVNASSEQTAYLEAKEHCAQPGCSGAGTKKCQGCMQGRYCGPACHLAHWPAHKSECRRLGTVLRSAPGAEGE
jgi:ankyrin repeat protein